MTIRKIVQIYLFTLLVTGSLVQAEDWVPYAYDKTIVVGVREESRPFSYSSSAKNNNEILKGYGGYMIEICRRVLKTMIRDVNSPFAGYQIVPRVVKASERFNDLKTSRIDMLCGPNSITLDRLATFNVSLPLFLSGISYISVEDDLLPRRPNDCKAIIGLLANTTAIADGLRVIAERGLLELYDTVLDQFLALRVQDEFPPTPIDAVRRRIKYVESLLKGENQAQQSRGRNAIANQSSIYVPTCQDGYKKGPGPVVLYDTHREGIEDLCEGRVLFYVGDVDILRWRLRSNPNCKDKYILHHETLTREAYAVFFLRPKNVSNRSRPQQTLLFSEFNNELMQKMQRIEGILDYEFSMEFRDVLPSEELSQFFSAYQFIKVQ